ncbi:redoxin domain-containing protein [Sphingobacterium humi]|uniref:Redoxin domain-containing protein n=2 Tax=Sphingobacterium humi TaxID=1796905 RepID=A0A6N8KWK5_9SPHI|nr:redoxin domain-containing protein [Sphingobacterium humi]
MIFMKNLRSILSAVSLILSASSIYAQQDSMLLTLNTQPASKDPVMLMYTDEGESKTLNLTADAQGTYRAKLPKKEYLLVSVMVQNDKNLLISSSGFTPKPMPVFLLQAGHQNQIQLVTEDHLASFLKEGGPESRLYEQIGKKERASMQKSWALILRRDSLEKAKQPTTGWDSPQKALREDISNQKKAFVKQHKDHFAGLEVFASYYMGLPIDSALQEFNSFNKQVQNTSLGKTLQQKLNAGESTSLGQVIPAFKVQMKDGAWFDSEALQGKYWLIDFWGSWCVPCRKSHPELLALYKTYQDKGFDILGIAFESGKLENQLKQWDLAIQEDGITWPQVLNSPENQLVKKFGVTSFPTKILVDPQGKIIYRSSGGNAEHLATKLNELLGEK